MRHRLLFALPQLALAACGDSGSGRPPSETACTPACAGRACGDDGCGGLCGRCEGDATCSRDGQCTPPAPTEDCTRTCADLAYACGDHCGARCGDCGAAEACVDHRCECRPTCGVATCEADDGCGGTCAACPRSETCPDCVLGLVVVDERVEAGAVREVTVAVDYRPPAGAALPGMADLRLSAEGDAELVEVAIGQALIDAHKELHPDPETGRPFRELSDGTLQLLILSTANTTPIPGGRWLFLTFRFPAFPAGSAGAPAAPVTPLVLSLVEREAIFAPTAADSALWGGHFGTPLVVWPDDTEVSHAP